MTHLRPAEPSDLPHLADILQDWLDATPWMPNLHSRAGTGRFLERLHATTEITVAVGAGIEGFVSLEGDEIPALYVAERARRQGVGSALITFAQRARSRLELWTFQDNVAARTFYAGVGFREVKRSDGAGNDEKLPDIRLEWSRA